MSRVGTHPFRRSGASSCREQRGPWALRGGRGAALALKGKPDSTPLILSSDCTNCGRCIDVCAVDVFKFTHRFDVQTVVPPAPITAPKARAS